LKALTCFFKKLKFYSEKKLQLIYHLLNLKCMDPFIGQIQIFGFNFAPQGWAFCNGQLISIASNTALFSLLGTTYGGNGQTTFALPDIRGRAVIHPGQGPGLTNIVQGQMGGVENVTLLSTNLPAHNHAVTATVSDANLDEPANGARLGTSNANIYASSGSANVTLASDSTTNVGGSQPFGIRSPFIGIYYSISLFGIFPSRN
jgi:microcystin-dependent protein